MRVSVLLIVLDLLLHQSCCFWCCISPADTPDVFFRFEELLGGVAEAQKLREGSELEFEYEMRKGKPAATRVTFQYIYIFQIPKNCITIKHNIRACVYSNFSCLQIRVLPANAMCL